MQTTEQLIFPSEEEKHEGTWLTWPHAYTYGKKYRDDIEPIWVDMTRALCKGENVHIIAYHEEEKLRIQQLLANAFVDMQKVDFVIAESDDVWIRDTGPIFVRRNNQSIAIANFGFDGWGKKVKHAKDNALPKAVATAKHFDLIDIGTLVLEGGAIELDGHGTLLATLSAVCSRHRNQTLNLNTVESYLKKYISVTHFIWLQGVIGEDITDAHIDGMARFACNNTLLMPTENDFYELYKNIQPNDYDILKNAKNANGVNYRKIELPLTAKNVVGLRYKGTYFNYYVGNEVVLVPTYRDKNDAVAIGKLSEIYANRKIVPIDVVSLFRHGGMIHCVTQQQPMI